MRLPLSLALALALAPSFGSLGCATYRQDLDRAKAHYEANEYEKALALFRVLEPDMDSYSDGEKTQYAYLRGMTDYRLASLATPGSGMMDPKKGFRDNARHWLALAAAIEKESQGGLSGEEKQRLDDAMTDLNKDVYGGGDAVADASGAAKPGDKPAADKPATDKPAADKPADSKKP
jgi:hypothetical protein